MTAPQGPDGRTSRGPGTPPAGANPPAGAAPPAGTAPTSAATAGRVGAATTVLPSTGPRRPPPRTAATRVEDRTSRPAARSRKARLALKRIDPWSVFVFSLISSVFLGIAVVAGVAALYAVLDGLGVQSSVNQLFSEITGGGGSPLITSQRIVGGAAVLAAANIVLLTLLATLGSLLYNLCASFTGGIELTLGERDG